jgi:DNA-binding IclR family transcriptional regulator
MLGTVTRAGRLLDLFTPERPEWGPTAAGRELGIAKSQAHELLMSLTAIGLLRRGRGGQFRLGWRTLALGRDVLRTQFPDGVFGVIRGLAQAFGEPVHFATLDREHVTAIARRPGNRGTDALLPTGPLDPYMHACATTKALLADLPEERFEQIVPLDLVPYTTATHIHRGDLRRELDAIRGDRIAFDHGEVVEELRGAAVPVREPGGETVAALGIYTRADRWRTTSVEMTRAISGAGHRIETLMRPSPTAVDLPPVPAAA